MWAAFFVPACAGRPKQIYMLPIIAFMAGTAFAVHGTFADPMVLAQKVAPPETPAEMRTLLSEYFEDAPVMVEIAGCESHFRHFGSNGEVLRGEKVRADVGVMQINTRYHLEDATELGMDLMSFEGNLAYAMHLYETQGTKPWNASRACWGKLALAK